MSRRPVRPADGGFTLLETMVALGIVGTVMASLSVFFVRSATVEHRQADMQVAAELATSAMDYVSQLPAQNVLVGRTPAGVQAELQAGVLPTGVSPYLAITAPASQEVSLPASTTVQGLPTAPETIQLTGDSTTYQRWWYVGSCWQPTTGGSCAAQQANYVQMYRIVVAITWPSPDCAGSQCQYVASMLTEATLDDPTWL